MPGAAFCISMTGVQQQASRIMIIASHCGNINTGPHTHRLHITLAIQPACGGRFIAMKLEAIYRYPVQYLTYPRFLFINKQRDYRGKCRQGINNLNRLFNLNMPGTGRIKHQAYCIGTQSGCGNGIIDTSKTANFNASSHKVI